MAIGANKYRGYRDLKVYQLSYQLALEIQEITSTFPKEEKYDEVNRMLYGMIDKADKFCK